MGRSGRWTSAPTHHDPGRIAAIRGAAGDHDHLLDVIWRPLPEPPDDPGFARRLARRRAVAIALLAEGESGDLVTALSELCPRGARVVARESDAAMLGAATTPGAGRAPFILDLGGGHGRSAPGAGSSRHRRRRGSCHPHLRLAVRRPSSALAERAKRHRSARVETPFTLHHEDGSRSFLGEPAPPDTLARLCALDGQAARPGAGRSSPRRCGRGCDERPSERCSDSTCGARWRRSAGAPRGELVLLVGGCAADDEVVDVVAGELEGQELAVARGDVLGRHGPRAAVAVGLVLTFAREGGR